MRADAFSFRSHAGSPAVIEFVEDDHLRIAIYDSMRVVKLSTLKRTLTEDERNEISAVILSRYKRCGWRVICYLDGRSASTIFMSSKAEP